MAEAELPSNAVMSERIALSLALMALTDQVDAAPDVREWAKARRVVRRMLDRLHIDELSLRNDNLSRATPPATEHGQDDTSYLRSNFMSQGRLNL